MLPNSYNLIGEEAYGLNFEGPKYYRINLLSILATDLLVHTLSIAVRVTLQLSHIPVGYIVLLTL